MEVVSLIISIVTLLAVLGLYGKPEAELTIVHDHHAPKRSLQAKSQKRDGHGRFTA